MAKILIVDDNEDMLDTLEHLFHFYEFEVAKAENGKKGIEAAKKEKPDIIILDALMPVMNGFDACRLLKEDPKTKDIPIIFLSANYTEDEHKVMGLELGADDYIVKPFNAKELIAKVKSILHKKELIEDLRKNNQQLLEQQGKVSKELESLRKKTDELEAGRITDPLTGLYNHAFFQKRFKEELMRAKRYNNELSVVVADVDLFHKINDVFGEQTGDYILMRIANVILNNTRYTDIVFRAERNRFIVLLPHTNETGAYYESERIRAAIDQTSFFDQNFYELKKLSPKRKQDYQHVTVSIGLVEIDANE
ncbi:MAG TPA: diguanylate cyclase, partial [Caldithrix sp.]|nr:diguanylate cyclase [Caldithrix sp.]